MKEILPDIEPAEFDQIAGNSAVWAPLLSQIAKATSSDIDLRQFAEGSNIVFASGLNRVIKVFPLFLEFQYKAEEQALKLVFSRVKTRTPELIASGYHDGWPYLIMERLGGVPLSEKWTLIDEEDKCNLLFRLGKLVAAHHEIHVDQNSVPGPSWRSFIEVQIENCVNRHTKLGIPFHLINDIPNFLKKHAAAVPKVIEKPVLLTGEYTPGNILLQIVGRKWEISGLIDYGDAMIGFSEYDLLGPCTFLACGNPNRFKSFLSGYGYGSETSYDELRSRLMVLLLLHRYSNLEVQIRIPNWKSVGSLDELSALVFPPF